MDYTFKAITLNGDERLWLQEIYADPKADQKKIKVKLWDKITRGFDPNSIDSRLYRKDHLTLVGVWHIDPESEMFDIVTRVIQHIRQKIIKNPDLKAITAHELSDELSLIESDVEEALFLMSELGRFFSSASSRQGQSLGYCTLDFNGDDGYDAYLNFHDLDTLMEDFFTMGRMGAAPNTISSGFFQTPRPTEIIRSQSKINLFPKNFPKPEQNEFFSAKFCSLFHELQEELCLSTHSVSISICFRTFIEILTDSYIARNGIDASKENLANRIQKAFSYMSRSKNMPEEARAFIAKLSSENEYFSVNTLHKVTHYNFQISDNDLRSYVNNLDGYIRQAILDVNQALEKTG